MAQGVLVVEHGPPVGLEAKRGVNSSTVHLVHRPPSTPQIPPPPRCCDTSKVTGDARQHSDTIYYHHLTSQDGRDIHSNFTCRPFPPVGGVHRKVVRSGSFGGLRSSVRRCPHGAARSII